MNTLQLADALERYDICASIEAMPDLDEVAAELRRLHEVNQELLEALEDLLNDTQHADHDCKDEEWCPVVNARAAIAKATGEQHG